MNKTANDGKGQAQVGLTAEVKIPVKGGDIIVDGMRVKSSLILGGKIEHKLGTNDVEGTLYMRGMWRKAFGVEWLALGNIMLG